MVHQEVTQQKSCLFCGAPLEHIFVDLGISPPSNAFLEPEDLEKPEIFYPLRTYVCDHCLLVQNAFYKKPEEIFTYSYVYHSSWSRSWVKHAAEYVKMMIKRFHLGSKSKFIEIGSNDGYLLQHVMAAGIPCLGIDPSGAGSVAQLRGIPTISDFFRGELAQLMLQEGITADVICGINVFAHIPTINDLVNAMRMLLKPQGVITMEFPHLLCLIKETQFDTIYHEHYFYYSLRAVVNIFKKHNMRVFDVEKFPTHGGSLRIFVCKNEADHPTNQRVEDVLKEEDEAGIESLDFYLGFKDKIEDIRLRTLSFLINAKRQKKTIAGFGAAAKGNTMINYFGIDPYLLPFVADSSPIKQGKYLPGSHIPVLSEDIIKEKRPDYVLILPWNLKEEISDQLKYIRDWGGQFVTAMPTLQYF